MRQHMPTPRRDMLEGAEGEKSERETIPEAAANVAARHAVNEEEEHTRQREEAVAAAPEEAARLLALKEDDESKRMEEEQRKGVAEEEERERVKEVESERREVEMERAEKEERTRQEERKRVEDEDRKRQEEDDESKRIEEEHRRQEEASTAREENERRKRVEQEAAELSAAEARAFFIEKEKKEMQCREEQLRELMSREEAMQERERVVRAEEERVRTETDSIAAHEQEQSKEMNDVSPARRVQFKLVNDEGTHPTPQEEEEEEDARVLALMGQEGGASERDLVFRFALQAAAAQQQVMEVWKERLRLRMEEDTVIATLENLRRQECAAVEAAAAARREAEAAASAAEDAAVAAQVNEDEARARAEAAAEDRRQWAAATSVRELEYAARVEWDMTTGQFESGPLLVANQERGTWYQGQQHGTVPDSFHAGTGGIQGGYLPSTSSRPSRMQQFSKSRTVSPASYKARAGEHNVSRAGRRVANNIATSLPDRNSAEAMALSVRTMGALLPAPRDRMNPPQRTYNTAAFGGAMSVRDHEVLELQRAVRDLQLEFATRTSETVDAHPSSIINDSDAADSPAEVNEKSGKSGQAGRGGTSLLPEEVKGGYESAARNWEIGDGAYYDTRDYYDLGRERYRGPMGASALQRSVQDLQVILSSS